jgi:hypothetical protein
MKGQEHEVQGRVSRYNGQVSRCKAYGFAAILAFWSLRFGPCALSPVPCTLNE